MQVTMTWCKATNQLTVLCTFKNHVKPGWRVRKRFPAPDIRNIPVQSVEHWGNLRNLWQCSLMHMHLTNKYSTSWPEKPFGRLPTASNRKALLTCSCIFRFVLRNSCEPHCNCSVYTVCQMPMVSPNYLDKHGIIAHTALVDTKIALRWLTARSPSWIYRLLDGLL